MNYRLGKPKDLDSITVEDVLENKIWIWTWEAGLEGNFDEGWQVPVIGIENVNNEFTSPIITLRIVGTDLIASGTFDHQEKKVFGIAFWKNNSWESIDKYSINEPIRFESLIKIFGNEKTEFILTDKKNDNAFMKNDNIKSWWKFWE
jgi:hypothetical protein